MDNTNKAHLEAAMISWKAKGNVRLAEACAIALENEQKKIKGKKSV